MSIPSIKSPRREKQCIVCHKFKDFRAYLGGGTQCKVCRNQYGVIPIPAGHIAVTREVEEPVESQSARDRFINDMTVLVDTHLKHQITAAESELVGLRAQAIKAESEIAGLKMQIQASDMEINRLKSLNQTLDANLAKAQTQLAEAQTVISKSKVNPLELVNERYIAIMNKLETLHA